MLWPFDIRKLQFSNKTLCYVALVPCQNELLVDINRVHRPKHHLLEKDYVTLKIRLLRSARAVQ